MFRFGPKSTVSEFSTQTAAIRAAIRTAKASVMVNLTATTTLSSTHKIRGISPNIFYVDLFGQPGVQRIRALDGRAADRNILQEPFDLQIPANDGYTLAYLEFSMFPGFTPTRHSAGDHIPTRVRTMGAQRHPLSVISREINE